MAGKIVPTMAFCAIGPDGKLDIGMIRRNQASAQSAAANILGYNWGALAGRQGWQVYPVRILAADAPVEDEIFPGAPPVAAPRSAPARAENPAPAPKKRSGPAILRCGDA